MLTDVFAFNVGRHRYAIPLADTQELFRVPSIVPLPKAPPVIEGVINIRGRVVPVLDIRKRFGLSPKAPHPDDHIVVARAKSRLVAFRADRAIGIVKLAPGDIEAARAITPRAEYLAGVAKLADGLVLIHDPGTFLTESEAQGLDSALDEAAVLSP